LCLYINKIIILLGKNYSEGKRTFNGLAISSLLRIVMATESEPGAIIGYGLTVRFNNWIFFKSLSQFSHGIWLSANVYKEFFNILYCIKLTKWIKIKHRYMIISALVMMENNFLI